MTLWQAIVYGIVQGITEFLPISSAAHLRIVAAVMGWTTPRRGIHRSHPTGHRRHPAAVFLA